VREPSEQALQVAHRRDGAPVLAARGEAADQAADIVIGDLARWPAMPRLDGAQDVPLAPVEVSPCLELPDAALFEVDHDQLLDGRLGLPLRLHCGLVLPHDLASRLRPLPDCDLRPQALGFLAGIGERDELGGADADLHRLAAAAESALDEIGLRTGRLDTEAQRACLVVEDIGLRLRFERADQALAQSGDFGLHGGMFPFVSPDPAMRRKGARVRQKFPAAERRL
jgi:hypothetical protein